MHGGDVAVKALEAIGVSVVFGLPGIQTGPIYDAIDRSKRIKHILMRDERNGAYAADAYARVTGQIGVCDATVGPGAVKLTSGLFEARNSSIPVLALISGHETYYSNYIEKGRISQGVDQLSVLKPVSKSVLCVTSGDRIFETIRIAAIDACSGVPGPVVIEFPADVLKDVVKPETQGGSHAVDAAYPMNRYTAPDESVAAAAELLSEAERPIIVAGGGVLISGAAQTLTDLVTEFSIPVISTFSGKGAVPDLHPMCLGLAGISGIPMNERVARSADVVVLVGTKCSQNTTFNWTFPEHGQRVIHIDVDPGEMNRFFPTHVCLVGDARLVLRSLKQRMRAIPQAKRDKWTEVVVAAKSEWARLKCAEQGSTRVPIAPQRVMKAVQDCIDEDTCVVADASFASAWVAEFLEHKAPGRYSLYPRGSAGLGWGLPAAIGVSAANKFTRVVVVAGDGGFTYSVSELATLRQYGYPVVSVVLNNASLGWWKVLNHLLYGRDLTSTSMGYTDFAAIAEGFGLKADTVVEPADLERSLSSLLDSGEAGVLNVSTVWNESPIWSYREALSSQSDETASMTSPEPGGTSEQGQGNG
ncbi:MAG: thiamine pyrophosphate-binding protein [Bacillota bacterium]